MMMKKVKLPLEMADGVQVRTIDELKNNWNLEKILNHFLTGRLLNWLKDRYYLEQADAIEKLDRNLADKELQKRICDIFEIKFVEESSINIDELNEKNRRLDIIRTYTDDDEILKNIDKIAFDQEEMACLLDSEEPVIYLFNNEFSIPLSVHNKTYIGVGRAEVVIKRKSLVDFDSLNIVLKNVIFDPLYNKILEKSPENLYKMGIIEEENKNFEKAYEYYKKLAVLNDARGWFNLGWYYSNGLGVKIDYEKANQNYLKAAEMGYSMAMNNLGAAYENGNGMEKNYGKAMEWYKKAAEAGSTFACKNIGNMYYYGKGVDVNYEIAVEWFKKSEDVAASCYNLGWMYEFGQGLIKNTEKAQEYYKKAADYGYYNSKYKWDPAYRYAKIVFDRSNNQTEAINILNKYYDENKKDQFAKEIRENINSLSFPYTSGWWKIFGSEFVNCSGERDGYKKLTNILQNYVNKFKNDLTKSIKDNTNLFSENVYKIYEAILLFGVANDNQDFQNIQNIINNGINEAINNINIPSASSLASEYEVGNEPSNTGSFFSPCYSYRFDYTGIDYGDMAIKEFKKYADNMVDNVRNALEKLL